MRFKLTLLALATLAFQAHADDFKLNGSIDFTQTFYGNAGKYKTSTSHPALVFNYNFAPKWNVQLSWDRTWNMYNYNGKENQQNNKLSQPSATLNYNYGNISGSQIGWSSALFLQNQNSFSGSAQNYTMLSTAFDFHTYLPQNPYFKATQFAISPMCIYGTELHSPSGHMNSGVMSLLTNWQLPGNFSLTLNSYLFREWDNGSMQIGNGQKSFSNTNYFMTMAWLQYSHKLHDFNDNTSLSFNFTGGYDPYIASNHSGTWDPFLAGNQMYQWLSPTVTAGNFRSTYSLFALPQLSLDYAFHNSIKLSAFVQAKYSNQVWGNTEKDWRIQPQIGVNAAYNF